MIKTILLHGMINAVRYNKVLKIGDKLKKISSMTIQEEQGEDKAKSNELKNLSKSYTNTTVLNVVEIAILWMAINIHIKIYDPIVHSNSNKIPVDNIP